MKSDWEVKKLSEVSEYISRGVTPSYDEEGMLVINQRCIRDNQINISLARRTNFSKKKVAKNKELSLGDILVNSTGVGTLGRVAQVKNLIETSTVDSHVTIIRPNNSIDRAFLGYIVISKQTEIENLAEGSTGQTELSRIRLGEEIEIPLPPLPTQKAIADTLSCLDDKIELNNKINKNLEEQAQALFKHWFIDFEFPDGNGQPYKSSGGKMVESELGLIPEGWRVGKLGEIVSVKSGFAFKSKVWKKEGCKVVRIGDIAINQLNFDSMIYIDKSDIPLDKVFHLFSGDILIAMTGATIGKTAMVPIYKETLLINQRVGKFIYKKNNVSSFIFCLVRNTEMNEIIVQKGCGSAQPNISANDIESIQITMPNSDFFSTYESIIIPLLNEIQNLVAQTQTLTQIRDALLPKLMSGEIEVPINKKGDM